MTQHLNQRSIRAGQNQPQAKPEYLRPVAASADPGWWSMLVMVSLRYTVSHWPILSASILAGSLVHDWKSLLQLLEGC